MGGNMDAVGRENESRQTWKRSIRFTRGVGCSFCAKADDSSLLRFSRAPLTQLLAAWKTETEEGEIT